MHLDEPLHVNRTKTGQALFTWKQPAPDPEVQTVPLPLHINISPCLRGQKGVNVTVNISTVVAR